MVLDRLEVLYMLAFANIRRWSTDWFEVAAINWFSTKAALQNIDMHRPQKL